MSMAIIIESTDQLIHMDGVPVRVWKGTTASGTPCFVFVHRIAGANSENQAEFERELKEQMQPGRVVDLRQVL